MMVVEIGYKKYILSPKNAVMLAEILDGAEVYEEKYLGGGGAGYSYHVYPQDSVEITLKLLPDSLYRMYKLAGKPEKT
jgi:hypothetical protein